MTTSQKLAYLKMFEQILNDADANGMLPFGVLSISDTEDKMSFSGMSFSPIRVANSLYGDALVKLGTALINETPIRETHKEVNPRNQNLN